MINDIVGQVEKKLDPDCVLQVAASDPSTDEPLSDEDKLVHESYTRAVADLHMVTCDLLEKWSTLKEVYRSVGLLGASGELLSLR